MTPTRASAVSFAGQPDPMRLGFAVKTRRPDSTLDVMREAKGNHLALLRLRAELARRGVGLADRRAG